MHTRVLPTLLGLLLLCVTAAHSGEVSAPPEFAQVREFIQQGVRVGRSPSVAIAVVKDDRIIWAEGFGLADIEAQRAANADSIYLLASVSKPMTATGMMVLVDRGERRPQCLCDDLTTVDTPPRISGPDTNEHILSVAFDRNQGVEVGNVERHTADDSGPSGLPGLSFFVTAGYPI